MFAVFYTKVFAVILWSKIDYRGGLIQNSVED